MPVRQTLTVVRVMSETGKEVGDMFVEIGRDKKVYLTNEHDTFVIGLSKDDLVQIFRWLVKHGGLLDEE